MGGVYRIHGKDDRKKMSKELFEALSLLEKEKGIDAGELLNNIKTALTVSIKKYYNVDEDYIDIEIDDKTKKFTAYLLKDIVHKVENPATQVSLEEAFNKSIKHRLGGVMRIKLDTKQIGRIPALAGKNLIHQGINEAAKARIAKQYQDKLHEVITARVVKIDPKSLNAIVELDKTEVTLFRNEQLPNDMLKPGDYVKVYVSDVVNGEKRCIIKITRNHKDLVKRLMEKEIPEIYDGVVEIKSISREAGSRTKVAVWSNDENVDPVGACIGPKGSRIDNILAEIKGEKIDIIKYSEDPAVYVAQALSPSAVESVTIISETDRICRVIVPDNQLSLAIGNKGQNAKLAAKLTGYKIDIKSESLLAQILEQERQDAILKAEQEARDLAAGVQKTEAEVDTAVLEADTEISLPPLEVEAKGQEEAKIDDIIDDVSDDDFELALARAMDLDDANGVSNG